MSKHHVVCLLELFRRAHDAHRVTYQRDRDKNRATLEHLGIPPTEMLRIVRDLRPEQALRAPWPNRNTKFKSETVCDFGTEVDGQEVYVKIAVVGTDDGAYASVVSFHLAEQAFNYPFK